MFEFATAARIIFGAGALGQAGSLVGALGRCALIVTGSDPGRAASLRELLAREKVHGEMFSLMGEPTIAGVTEGVNVCRQAECQVVIGFGGGSALDAAKAIAGLATNPGMVTDYLEVIGSGKPLLHPGLPFIAIPTTAGTGTEVTRNAVLASREHRVKASLRSPHLLARIALVDPDLTANVPAAVAAATGLDALTQLIEPFVSVRANPLTDAICRAAIPRAARSLPRLLDLRTDSSVRADMAWASLCGGLALANAALGAVHGFAAPLGGMFTAPHGALCAALLPQVMAMNVQALRERDPMAVGAARYQEVASLLTGSSTATAEDGIEWVSGLCDALHIPPLGTYGITEADLEEIANKAAAASSMKGNPIALTSEEREKILRAAL